MICWQEHPKVPRSISAVLTSLQFFDGCKTNLHELTAGEWRDSLAFCDRHQLTLLLDHACRGSLPDPIRERIESNISSNVLKLQRVRTAFLEIASAFRKSGLDFVALKGLTQSPAYVSDPKYRAQYDIDLLCPEEQILPARDALLALDYEPVDGREKLPTDHLPTMMRRTSWRWRGDWFDPEMPIAVDLHFRLWDEGTERFEAPGVNEFWARRTSAKTNGCWIPVLHPADALAYTSLHLLRHILRGSIRLCHAYELAYFLQTHADDDTFWNTWEELHHPRLRQLEAVCFRLCSEWFGCRLSPTVLKTVGEFSPNVQAWFEEYAAAPVLSGFHPNKDELWLHLSLLDSSIDRLKVLRRRLLPAHMPEVSEALPPRDVEITPAMRLKSGTEYAIHVARRAAHHLRLIPRSTLHGLAWWSRVEGLGSGYWSFLSAACLFSFGTFVFFLLYNLYLLDRGFDEKFLGLITAVFTAGSLAATIPAGALTRKLGLRRTLLWCAGAMAGISVLRTLPWDPALLLVCSFATGVCFSVWAVSIPPVIARVTTKHGRPLGFSLFFSSGIAVGILGGLVGGTMPLWFAQFGIEGGPARAKQWALLVACAASAAALFPLSRFRVDEVVQKSKRIYPWNPFLLQFLLALAVWNIATGAFNPFFNAYFSRRMHMSVTSIGSLFSGAQLAQVFALLLAPLVLRRLGAAKGIMAMQLAAAVALGAIAAAATPDAAVVAYTLYMAFQWMCEPGMYTILMDRVRPDEQGGASALNFTVAFGAQAVAAGVAGAEYARFGYPAVIGVAAALAASAALLFRWVISKRPAA